MSWSLRYAIKSYVLSAIWTAPVIAVVLEQVTFRIAYVHQLDFGWIPGFVVNREGTIALADYLISSSIAFVVFTFSSLIVAIQVASGQLTPRIIATTLLRDRVIRWSVGLFVYVLLLAIGIKARVDTVPRFLVSTSAIFGLVSVVAFMFLIDHAARLLRPVNIVWRLAQQGLVVIDDVYPDPIPPSSIPPQAPEDLGPPERTILHTGSSAILIAVNLKALVAEAKREDVIIELVPRVGDFVAKDDALFRLRGRGATQLADRFLRGQVAFGRERTIEQDSTFASRVIVDIAIKALSPAINDPTTAVIAIDQLQRLLRTVGKRDLRNDWIRDGDGKVRVIFGTPDWEDFVHLTFREVRHYGAGNFQVVRRLRAMIENILQSLPESRLPAVRQERELLDRTVEKLYMFPEDLALARIPDPQGLGGGSAPIQMPSRPAK
ncbi:MAG TPA: DUF2254 domain-containing protein [Deltaproteobacteria bacterium]|jgi:uncharacterized membrane protein|nr:DUF2254 domain-containing protein [Deltaproteobacteria bacterium]